MDPKSNSPLAPTVLRPAANLTVATPSHFESLDGMSLWPTNGDRQRPTSSPGVFAAVTGLS